MNQIGVIEAKGEGGFEQAKATAEAIVAWAAIAYAGGFITIMLHTYRIGIPVVQQFEAINVWVGAPLAIVAYLSKSLMALVKRRHANFVEVFKNIKEHVNKLKSLSDLEVFDEYIAAFASLFPFRRLTMFLYRDAFRRQLEKMHEKKPEGKIGARAMKLVTIIVAFSHGYAAVWRYGGFLVSIALVPTAIFYYVWHAYPKVPQEFGGGRPTIVQLVLSGEAVPENAHNLAGLFAPNQTNTSRLTVPLDLLLVSEGFWYLRHTNSAVIAFSADKIASAVWPHKRSVKPLQD
jgi:hypothetical protein